MFLFIIHILNFRLYCLCLYCVFPETTVAQPDVTQPKSQGTDDGPRGRCVSLKVLRAPTANHLTFSLTSTKIPRESFA